MAYYLFENNSRNIRGRSYIGTLYIKVSRARKNNTRLQHTVLLCKLFFFFFLQKCARKFICAPFIEYRHRFLSFFFHSNHFSIISLMASLNLALKQFFSYNLSNITIIGKMRRSLLFITSTALVIVNLAVWQFSCLL